MGTKQKLLCENICYDKVARHSLNSSAHSTSRNSSLKLADLFFKVKKINLSFRSIINDIPCVMAEFCHPQIHMLTLLPSVP